MGNPEVIEIEGLKIIHKLCKFAADRGMEGCTFTEIVEPLPKQKQKKRRKKTVSEIDLQIKELQKKKETLILKSTSEIGNFILSVLAEKDITVEDIENNQELFKLYI